MNKITYITLFGVAALLTTKLFHTDQRLDGYVAQTQEIEAMLDVLEVKVDALAKSVDGLKVAVDTLASK